MGRRKSIFSFFSSQKPTPPSNSPTEPQQVQPNQGPLREPSEQERYIPRQWEPNRLATLYVSPSERNLYLAAMAQLDQNPPSLPLWSDPSPSLPLVQHQPPIDSTPLRAIKMPLSPKLVTSPDLPIHGLSIREEFRSPTALRSGKGGKEGQKHALLAFMGESGLRFHNFPVAVLGAVDEAIKVSWDRGIKSYSESLGSLQKKSNVKEFTWEITLRGKVWRQAGHSELDSIRLMLTVLTTLGMHGWYLVEKMQATGSKNDHHNLLFIHSPLIQLHPPAFFAVSIPLPDRISLISPPAKATPGIISSVREAIHSQSRQKGSSVVLMDGRGSVKPALNPEWDSWKGDIKVEGWVYPGVYRFWLGGLRTWLGNSVKWRIVEKLHPGLIISIINELSNQNFDLLTSLPLLPILKGRDILIFASNPQSGLTARDTWISQPTPPTPPLSPSMNSSSSAYPSESPVIVDPEEVIPERGEMIPPELRDNYTPKDIARREAANGMAEDRLRDMENVIGIGDPSPKSRYKQLGLAEILAQEEGRIRTVSEDSRQRLIPSNAGSTRRRNLLIKKSSLKRKTSNPTSPPTHGDTISTLRRRVSSLTDQGSRRVTDNNNHRHASIDGRYNLPPSSFDHRNTVGDEINKVNITGRHGVGSEISTTDGEWDMVELPMPSREGLGLSIYTTEPPNDPLPLNPSAPSGSAQQPSISTSDHRIEERYPGLTALTSHHSSTPSKGGKEKDNDPKDKITSTRPLSVLNALAKTGSPPLAPQPLPSRPVQTPLPARRELELLPSHFTVSPRPMQSRQSVDSVRTQYYDAETPGLFTSNQQSQPFSTQVISRQPFKQDLGDNLFGLRPDSLYSEIDSRRELRIMNKTPPSHMILSPSIPMEVSGIRDIREEGQNSRLDAPLLSPRSPLRGRNDLIEQNVGVGVESVAGSVGYLNSIASQSVLGLKEIPRTPSEMRQDQLEERREGDIGLNDSGESGTGQKGTSLDEEGGEKNGKAEKQREKEKGDKGTEKIGSSRTRILFGRK